MPLRIQKFTKLLLVCLTYCTVNTSQVAKSKIIIFSPKQVSSHLYRRWISYSQGSKHTSFYSSNPCFLLTDTIGKMVKFFFIHWSHFLFHYQALISLTLKDFIIVVKCICCRARLLGFEPKGSVCDLGLIFQPLCTCVDVSKMLMVIVPISYVSWED